jgi:signal transduction histidine kinase
VGIAVHDEGIGIAPRDHARIFERFERASSVEHYSGLGLGLYIARAIASAHGGSVAVDSHNGAGTTFTLSLPFAFTSANT